MTYDRMQAKRIPGKVCQFCGDDDVPLVKTPCCEKWICCDTAFFSFRGGDYCQYEHERFSLCFFHHNEGHLGHWQDCDECRKDLGDQEYERSLKHPGTARF